MMNSIYKKNSPCQSLATEQGENKFKIIKHLNLNINDISIKSIVKFAIHKEDGVVFMTTKGRQAQALYCLIKAGNKGITALEVSSWALRLAVYVFALRYRFGLNIITKDEPQLYGLQPYARYILQDDISIVGIR